MFCFSCATADASGGEEWNPAMVQQLYKQSLKANNGRLIVHGLFARANSVNNNMRLYPKKILAREVRKYIRDQVQAKCALGELDHPSYCAPTFKHLNLVNISHQVLSVRWRGNTLWGFIEVLDTPSGRLIKHLYSRGCKLGVSSRGWASLRELPGKDYKCIMDNFELITFDFVTEPSTRGAWLLPYAGSYQQAMPQQPFAEVVSRLGVGAVLPEQFPMLPSIRETRTCLKEYRGHLRETNKCFPVRRMQGPQDWVVSERRKRDVNGEGRRRSEPAATDTTIPGIGDAVCRGMADGFPMHASPLIGRADDPGSMMVPVATSVIMAYPSGFQQEARVCYGAYVAMAHVFGVPSQRGLRDYWRHVFLFRERALAAAQLDSISAPISSTVADSAAVPVAAATSAVPPLSGATILMSRTYTNDTTGELGSSASTTIIIQEVESSRSQEDSSNTDLTAAVVPACGPVSVVAGNRPQMPGMLVWDNVSRQTGEAAAGRCSTSSLNASSSFSKVHPEQRRSSVALQFDRWRGPEQGGAAAAPTPQLRDNSNSAALPVVSTSGGKAEVIHPAQPVSSHRHTRTGSNSTVLDFRTNRLISGAAGSSSLGSSPVKAAVLKGDGSSAHHASGPSGPGVAVAASAMFGEPLSSMHGSMHGRSGLGIISDTAFDAVSGSCESVEGSESHMQACIAPAMPMSSTVSSRFADVESDHDRGCGSHSRQSMQSVPQQLLLFQTTDPGSLMSSLSSLGKASSNMLDGAATCGATSAMTAPQRTSSPQLQYVTTNSPDQHQRYSGGVSTATARWGGNSKSSPPSTRGYQNHNPPRAPSPLRGTPNKSGPALEHDSTSLSSSLSIGSTGNRQVFLPRPKRKMLQRAANTLWQSAVAPLQSTNSNPPKALSSGGPGGPCRASGGVATPSAAPAPTYIVEENPIYRLNPRTSTDSRSSTRDSSSALLDTAPPQQPQPPPPLLPPAQSSPPQHSSAIGGRQLYPMMSPPDRAPHGSPPNATPTRPNDAHTHTAHTASPSPFPPSATDTPTTPQGRGRSSSAGGSSEDSPAVVVVVSATSGIGRKRFSEVPLQDLALQDPLQSLPGHSQSIPS